MILQALVRHYEALVEQGAVSRPLWCHAKVSYALDIGRDGSLLGIIFLKQENVRGKKTVWSPQPIEVPEMVARSSGISANFLCDNSKYLLGIDAEGSGKRIRECFEATRERHLKLLEPVHSEAAEAVKNFFRSWDPERARENPAVSEKWDELTEGGNLIFFAGGYAQEDPDIREAWESSQNGGEGGSRGTCLVTGQEAEISRIHGTIKGVKGAQSSGAALVSFNAPSFESYGKEQSYNAPVGNYASFAYTTALNYLLTRREHVFQLGDTTVLYWAEDGEEVYQRVFEQSTEPEQENQNVLSSIFKDLSRGSVVNVGDVSFNPNQPFYVLGLAPNAARLSVRFFYRDSIGAILSNLEQHYQRMEVVRPAFDDREYLGIWRMLQETVNQKAKEKKPQPGMAASVFRAILSNGRYPESLYASVLIRIRAEQGKITRGRAGIIKAHLIRNYQSQWLKEEEFMGLNEDCESVAYIMGREFAVLEAIQREAYRGHEIKTTIKDRYFNAACAAPASVFPILQKLSNSHMRKIENKKFAYRYENMMIDLQGKVPAQTGQALAYPRRLNLEEQGMFILGYYHQVQKLFEKKEDK